MEEFFASLYEWFGPNPFYSEDMAELMRGWDITCTDYIGTPWYVIIGWSMVAITAVFYVLQYHIIDSSKFNKKHHWWIVALAVVLINFLNAFLIMNNTIQAGDYCTNDNIAMPDSIGIGLSNAIWSLILFILLTSFKYPRNLGINCSHTTFWKP